MLTIVQQVVRIGTQPNPEQGMAELLAGRNHEANQAAASLFAEATAGMFRAKSVAPPLQSDGLIRIVDIEGLDQQACGGTHLASTGHARRIRILKVENKGRQNRRLRIGLMHA